VKAIPDNVKLPSRGQLPPNGKTVIVNCREFRCLAYVDKEGIWRDDFKSEELVGVISWEEI